MIRLVETPNREDLEEVIYWAKNNGRQWKTNDDNEPLRADGTPFTIDEDGLISYPGKVVDIDPQEREESNATPITMVVEDDEELPERLVFRLKMLLGRDHNEITQAMIKTKTRTTGKRRNRQAVVETEMDLTLAVNLKLQKAIEEWEGIADKDGNPAAITPENINLLPAWLQNDLVDRVDEMSSLDEEEEGE